jgi:hypothetical protein
MARLSETNLEENRRAKMSGPTHQPGIATILRKDGTSKQIVFALSPPRSSVLLRTPRLSS